MLGALASESKRAPLFQNGENPIHEGSHLVVPRAVSTQDLLPFGGAIQFGDDLALGRSEREILIGEGSHWLRWVSGRHGSSERCTREETIVDLAGIAFDEAERIV